MPTVTDSDLTLTVESNARVTVRVTANVSSARSSASSVGLGTDWHPHVTLHDFDGAATAPARSSSSSCAPGTMGSRTSRHGGVGQPGAPDRDQEKVLTR